MLLGNDTDIDTGMAGGLSEEELLRLYNPKFTPATLTAYLDDGWIPTDHLMFISAKIASAIKRGGGRIIVSLPPRHGKSRLLSIGSTTWVAENYGHFNTALCTYGLSLSTDFSGAVRDQIEMNPDKLSVRIKKGSNRLDKFNFDEGGGVYAFGLMGPMTGRGFHVFFLDDFIKHIKEATSALYRQQTWDWFTTTAWTRLEPGATAVIVATRWHDDDLIGRILDEFKGEWEYIRLPAIAEPGDPLGRQPGEALFPERYPVEELLKLKRMLGSFWFSAIYQQDPKDDSSKMADKDWLQYVGQLPHPASLTWARVWDFAGTRSAGDYTCGMLFGADKENERGYIADIVRDQQSPDDLDTLFKETAEKDGKAVPIIILREPGASGLIATNHFKKLVPDYLVSDVPELQNKTSKAHAALAGAERGDLFLLLAAWNDAFAGEFDHFPNSDYDDQMDCLAVAWNELIGVVKSSATWGRRKPGKPGDRAVRGGPKGPSRITWGRRKSGLYVPQRRL